jgi:hypothetical protein
MNEQAQKIKDRIKSIVREVMDEMSTTSGVSGFQAPMAFSRKGSDIKGSSKTDKNYTPISEKANVAKTDAPKPAQKTKDSVEGGKKEYTPVKKTDLAIIQRASDLAKAKRNSAEVDSLSRVQGAVEKAVGIKKK